MKTNKKILLPHGSGGRATHELVERVFLKRLNNPILNDLNDQAVFQLEDVRLAFSTDSYVVDPIFFPGGDIGKLAVNGTVNDIAMSGATPMYLSAGFIIEEGFSLEELEKVLDSMKEAAEIAQVSIVAGDTKVVAKGGADKIFINTSGVGIVPGEINISGHNAKVGDKVIVSGPIGDHGIAVLSKREGLEFETDLISDCAPLNHLVSDMLKVSQGIHTLRDPTRGGLATVLNEVSGQANVGIVIYEDSIPVRPEVSGACELLGLDPLYVANEGRVVTFVVPQDANSVLAAMKKNIYGKEAEIIGEVVAEPEGKVLMRTKIGGTRIVDMLTGEQLPRIC
jgi:hydrogenase expression/formation protein HypE